LCEKNLKMEITSSTWPIQNMSMQTNSTTTWNINVPILWNSLVKFQNHPSRQRNEGKNFNINLSQLRAILNKENFHTKITNLQIKSIWRGELINQLNQHFFFLGGKNIQLLDKFLKTNIKRLQCNLIINNLQPMTSWINKNNWIKLLELYLIQ
jgi:hypothetical protein